MKQGPRPARKHFKVKRGGAGGDGTPTTVAADSSGAGVQSASAHPAVAGRPGSGPVAQSGPAPGSAEAGMIQSASAQQTGAGKKFRKARRGPGRRGDDGRYAPWRSLDRPGKLPHVLDSSTDIDLKGAWCSVMCKVIPAFCLLLCFRC
jgi:hypothetical protein